MPGAGTRGGPMAGWVVRSPSFLPRGDSPLHTRHKNLHGLGWEVGSW